MSRLSGGRRATLQAFLLGSVIFYVSPCALAAEYGYSLEYRGEHSDNVTLVHNDTLSDWINIGQATVYLRDPNSQTLRTNIFLDARYENYSNNTVADQTYATLNSNLTWLIMPEALSWVVEDYYGQISRNVLDPNAPSNLQNVNVFSTGPDANLRINPINFINASLRAGKYNAEQVLPTDPNQDSTRYYGMLGWRHTASATTDLYLNYDSMRRVFQDSTSNRDYDLSNLYFRLESRRTATSRVSLDLGKSRVVPDGLRVIDGNLVRALYTRSLSLTSNLEVAANSQLTDSSNAILSSGGVNSVTTPIGTVGTGDVYRIKELSTTYTQSQGFSSNRVRLFVQRQSYEVSLLNLDRAGANLDLGFGLSDTLSGTVFGNYTNTNYIDQGFIDRDGQLGVRLAYRARPRVVFGLEARKTNRNSSDSTRDYNETRLGVSIAYQSIAFRTGQY